MDAGDRTNEALRDLWALTVATTAPEDAGECARLMATGIPSLVPCSLSGCALLEGERWSLSLQQRGEQLSGELGQSVSAELDELMNRVIRHGDLLMLSDESVPPLLRGLGAECTRPTQEGLDCGIAAWRPIPIHRRHGKIARGRHDRVTLIRHRHARRRTAGIAFTICHTKGHRRLPHRELC